MSTRIPPIAALIVLLLLSGQALGAQSPGASAPETSSSEAASSRAAAPGASSEVIRRVEKAVEVLDQFQGMTEEKIPTELFRDARAVAVFPGVINAGFLIGGRYGRGLLSIHEQDGGWSDPVFLEMAGASIGFQAGAASTDIVLVFKTRQSLENILRGEITLGAGATVAAGPVGRHVEAATDAQLEAEIYSYSRSRGVFAGISLEGATIEVDDDANVAFYGREVIQPADIVAGQEERFPEAVDRLRQALQRVSRP